MRIFRRIIRAILRKSASPSAPHLEATSYPNVRGRIHVRDDMLIRDPFDKADHYVQVGQEAVDNMEQCLRRANRSFSDLEACLDLPCGYGRVLRNLAAHIESRKITASDVNAEAVAFCEAEFGVNTLASHADLGEVEFPHKYDLIWSGSLATHLPPDECLTLFRLYERSLAPNGVLVFTTHGSGIVEYFNEDTASMDMTKDAFLEILSSEGVCYRPFPDTPRYGFTVHTEDYIRDTMASLFSGTLKFLWFKECGWDGRQDVWGYQKTV